MNENKAKNNYIDNHNYLKQHLTMNAKHTSAKHCDVNEYK